MKTLKTELIRNGFHLLRREIDRKNTKTKDKPKERLTDRDWAEIMGTNRQTYKRVNGAVRRR